MSAMEPYTRVATVLAGGVPDRPPIIVGVSNATGIKMTAYKDLLRHLKENEGLDLDPDPGYIYDWPELGTAIASEGVLRRLGTDVRPVHDRFPTATVEANRARPAHSDYIDDWGSGAVEIRPGEWYPGRHPLKEAGSVAEIEAYSGWPDMDDPHRVSHVREAARSIREEGTYGIMATPWLLFPLERAFAMQGMDRFLMNLSINPAMAAALLTKTTDLSIRLMTHFLDELGPNVDIIKIGDDLGTQENLLISPDMYREFLKPCHRRLIEAIRRHSSAKVFFHTDGDVFSLIEDFIEIGVDVLNPIQTSAGRMSDLPALKKQFGDRIVFCGAVDTQHVLPHGTTADVQAETRRVCSILGEGGGYMVASVHTIMNEVPPENILAMVDAVQEMG